MSIFRGAREVFIGSDDLDELFAGHSKAFIVCDPFVVKSGMSDYITEKLSSLNIECIIYDKVGSDPSIDLVAEGVSEMSTSGADIIIAFGGGSAIDQCKAMMFFALRQQLCPEVCFVAVPTTSGTGSEVTDYCVITDTEKEIKYPLLDEKMLPDASILDAELTKSVPPSVTAATGMDVLTHAMESMLSTGATEFSNANAEKAIKLIRTYLIKCYRKGDDMVARQKMHHASNMAGVAFNNSGLGINHSCAHTIGAHYHIPHGVACALMMPYVIRFNAGNEEARKNYARIARLIKVNANGIDQSVENLVRTIFRFERELGIPNSIKEYGVDKDDFSEDLEEMVESAMKDPCTKTNPRQPSKEEIRQLLIDAYFGDKIKIKKF